LRIFDEAMKSKGMITQSTLIVTCEHGGNRIPGRWRGLFKEGGDLLATHRGYDLGALGLARAMAACCNAPLHAAVVSRLLVDLNRSIGHPRLFSQFTRSLSSEEKERILRECYAAHRDPIEAAVGKQIARGRTVVHIACHSFTPVLDGWVRDMDIGLLYDPDRAAERRFCEEWKKSLQSALPGARIRRNVPYKGISDGLATYFRKRFPENYLGIELEMNQRNYLENKTRWRRSCAAVIETLKIVKSKK
jgi:predicted N-formylglutamate amidohydrolase